ncbi:MAG: GntR family transcriptional regulator [Spirochaetaceae bacterium]|nr:GntR family transcriptional regulator [Spirochaetaceae bacterium]
MTAGDKIEVPQRASDQAYDQLLERILDLRIPPGAVVHEQQLADEIGFGRMPVREAIARLASDRFITVMPRRGTVVTALSLEDVLNMFEAREAIECGVAYIAARRASDEDLATLRDLIKAAEKARKGAESENFLRDDYEIHAFLVHMVNNSLLQDAAQRLLQHNLRFWRSYWSTRPVQHSSMLSHSALLTALEARNSQAAEEAMREHIGASKQLLQSVF